RFPHELDDRATVRHPHPAAAAIAAARIWPEREVHRDPVPHRGCHPQPSAVARPADEHRAHLGRLRRHRFDEPRAELLPAVLPARDPPRGERQRRREKNEEHHRPPPLTGSQPNVPHTSGSPISTCGTHAAPLSSFANTSRPTTTAATAHTPITSHMPPRRHTGCAVTTAPRIDA